MAGTFGNQKTMKFNITHFDKTVLTVDVVKPKDLLTVLFNKTLDVGLVCEDGSRFECQIPFSIPSKIITQLNSFVFSKLNTYTVLNPWSEDVHLLFKLKRYPSFKAHKKCGITARLLHFGLISYQTNKDYCIDIQLTKKGEESLTVFKENLSYKDIGFDDILSIIDCYLEISQSTTIARSKALDLDLAYWKCNPQTATLDLELSYKFFLLLKPEITFFFMKFWRSRKDILTPPSYRYTNRIRDKLKWVVKQLLTLVPQEDYGILLVLEDSELYSEHLKLR